MSVSAEDFRFVADLLLARLGIKLEDDKGYLVEARLEQVALRKGLTGGATEIIGGIRRDPGSRQTGEALEALTTNETYFFRDDLPFKTLRDKVLPDLIEKRKQRKALNIWSGACSTGQEPYSIAITLKEGFSRLSDWNIQILASDISASVLAKARSGAYTATDVARGLAPDLQTKYFARKKDDWILREDIRNAVRFFSMNLCENWLAFPKLDVIFLRNVLIYLPDDRKRAILAKVKSLLEPDGYLFLGPAETTYRIEDSFRKLEGDRAGCFRPL
jgi:chemotaxis protein methyltransferase CheR